MWGWVGVGLLLVAAQGCHVTFDVHAEGQATIPSDPLAQVLAPLGPLQGLASFDISQTQDFKNQGVSKSQVESVKLKSLVLSITQPQGQDFSFLDSIQFLAGADGQKTVVVAHMDSVPRNVSSFPLDLNDVELVDYVAAPSMAITASASGRPPDQDTTLKVAAVFTVVAKL